jgi:poly-gamma-glutamate capsule biosynthesis protein CapA/YwtB (metallophosphatase superfamily)
LGEFANAILCYLLLYSTTDDATVTSKEHCILQSMKRKLLVFALIGTTMGGLAWYWQGRASTSLIASKPAPAISNQTAKTAGNTVRMYAMGDMLPHDSVVAQAKNSIEYDFANYFATIKTLYSDADAVFCNPEAPVSGDTYGVSGYPAFNAPSAFARDLRADNGAGCNVITMGNNHINDRGQAALNSSIDVWQNLKPVAVSGANKNATQQQQVPVFTQNGITIAFVALNEYHNRAPSNTYAANSLTDEALVRSLMTKATSSADAVIVSIHWKQENRTKSSSEQQRYARLVATLGADVIIGTGPHVWQEVAYLPSTHGKQTLVWYSIGNMLSSQLTVDQLTSGIAGFSIHKDQTNKITIDTITIDPTFMSYDWPPADKAAQNLAARSNLRLRPLKDADASIQTMFGLNYSANERLSFLKQTVGTDVPVVYR